MNVPTDSSSPRLGRYETAAVVITSAVAAIALGYGLFVGHPPVAFVLICGLLGATFMALLLWGIRRNRYLFALCIALCVYWLSYGLVPRIFFGRAHEVSWPVFSANSGRSRWVLCRYFPQLYVLVESPNRPSPNDRNA